MKSISIKAIIIFTILLAVHICWGEQNLDQNITDLLNGKFRWKASQPLVTTNKKLEDFCYSVKDPSIVFYQGKWHLFCTIRSQKRTHQIEYLSFSDWEKANTSFRAVLKMHNGYFCAPQVFYFEPHNKWYLICQASDESWQPNYQPAYCTSDNIADPDSWSRLEPIEAKQANGKSGLDFWIICDETKAYLFFTTLDGNLWQEETPIADFPKGWSEPILAINGDIFEASHTYKLKGLGKYLTLVEAQNGHGWRYYKAYLADRLDGEWMPLADSRDKSFASMANVQHSNERWTDCISHGELIRLGYNQKLEVNPANLLFLFQGVLDKDKADKPYGQIPWRLGILEME